MNTLLVPVDGSQSSLNALRTALAFMEKSHPTQLHVIAVHPPILSGNIKRFISAEALNDYYNEEGEKLLAPAREILEKAAVAASINVVVGPIANSIVEYAEKHQCDHIVMGTRGMGYIKGFVLGSVTTKVLSLADIPVTLVK